MKRFTYTFICFVFLTTSYTVQAQTCSDGIQNGTETGVDCGGTCPPCSTPCQISLSYEAFDLNAVFQEVNMTNGGNLVDCSVTFLDPGGNANYTGGASTWTHTFCSEYAGSPVSIDFSSFNLWVGSGLICSTSDVLYIYNGPSVASPLIGSYNGSNSPGIISASSGCVTFRFVRVANGGVFCSTNSGAPGWSATISCNPIEVPCGGGDVVLTAVGQGASTLALDNDFDFGNAGAGWTSNVNADFSNPCDASIDGGTYMWMGNSAEHPRIIQTVPLDLSCGGEICFWLDFATQAESSPCEGIDLPGEGVFLEYSIDGGTSWTTIEYFGPAGVGNSTASDGYNAQMTSWNQYCYSIPPAAETPNTIIHWAQTGSSGVDTDHWGLDNVSISSIADCTPYWYDYTYLPPAVDGAIQNTSITGTTTFEVIYTNGIDACSTTVVVPVAPCPCPDAIVSGGGTYCAGDSIPNVVFTVTDGNNPLSLIYAIDGVAQAPVTFSTNTFTLFDPIEGQYTILGITDPSLCVGTFSGSVTVTENPVPVFNSVSSGDTYCVGDVIADIIVDATGAGPITVAFTIDGVAQTPVTGTTPISLGNGAGVYEVTSISDGTCSLDVSASETIVINPIPVATAGTSTASLCAGESILLTGNTTTGTYAWTGPGGFTSTSEDPAINNATVNQSGTYTLIVTENGCVSPPSTVEITVNAVPVVTTDANSTICIGTAVTLNGQGATTYTWSGGITNGVPFTPNSTVTYTVTGTSNGCTATATVTVTVLPLPIADASTSADYGYQPLVVTFDNNSINATSYVWDFGTGQTSNSSASSVTNTFSNVGTFYIVLTASNGICSDTWTDSVVVIPYPAMEIDVPNVFTPNGDGSNDIYFINIVNGTSFEAVILNRWGNVVFTIDTLNAGWDGNINGKEANEGVYFIKYSAKGLDGQSAEGHTNFHLVR
jgi:gliding motility-associated-like protein